MRRTKASFSSRKMKSGRGTRSMLAAKVPFNHGLRWIACILSVALVLTLVDSTRSVAFGQTQKKTTKKSTSKKANTKKGTAKTKKATGLPAEFSPPPKPPPYMTLTKELITDAEEAAFDSKKKREFKSAFDSRSVGPQERKLITMAAKWHIYRMTMEKYRRKLPELRTELFLQLRNLRAKQTEPRKYFLQQITSLCKDLLDNNFYVRINAVYVLSGLNIREPQTAKQIPATAYVNASGPMIDALKDPKQIVYVKLAAVSGLNRIFMLGSKDETPPAKRVELAKIYIDQLKDAKHLWWYQRALIEGLPIIGISTDPKVRDAFVVHNLATILVDKNRDYRVRAAASRSLASLPLEPSMNIPALSYLMVDMGHQFAVEYNKNPESVIWRECFFGLYLAYQPINKEARAKGYGLLTRWGGQTNVKSAYQNLLPVVNHVLGQPQYDLKNPLIKEKAAPIPDLMLQGLKDWLKTNPPNNYRVSPTLPPISAGTGTATANELALDR